MTAPADGTTHVVFRYDDFCADGPGQRDSNTVVRQIWQAEQAIDRLFQKYGMPYVVAVVPKAHSLYGSDEIASEGACLSQDKEKVDFLNRGIQAGRIELAQHGLSHTNYTAKNHKPGEFLRSDYQSQLDAITQGRRILADCCPGARIAAFVPPWNAWNCHTVKALKEARFSILSADRHYYHEEAAALTIIPFTAQLWQLEEMLLQGTLTSSEVIVVMYHPPQIVRLPGRQSRYFGPARFEKLLQQLGGMPDVEVVTFTQLARQRNDLTFDRYRQASNLWFYRKFWARLLPSTSLPGQASRSQYLTTQQYAQKVTFWKTITIGSAAALLLGGLLIRYLIGRTLPRKWRLPIDVLAATLCCAGIAAEWYLTHRGYHINAIRAIPVIFFAGFLVARIPPLLRRGNLPRAV